MNLPDEIFANEGYTRFNNPEPFTESDIPLKPEARKRTDTYFLVIFILSVVVLIPFLIFTVMNSDIYNLKVFNRIHKVEDERTEFRFQESSLHDPFASDRKIYPEKIVSRLTLAACIPVGICVILAALFRYATGVVVWGILIISWICFFTITMLLWMMSYNIFSQIMFTIFTITLLCILVFMKDKVYLVIKLFKEASKAVFDMQPIFSIPGVTVLILLGIGAAFGTTTAYTWSDPSYIDSNVVIATIVLNSVIFIWAINFIIGIQYMIVSGAIIRWYFTRNKGALVNPVSSSIHVTLKYHLGTAAFGSLIITLVTLLRAFLRSLARNPRLRWLVDCCMSYIEGFLRFFTKNSYIVTAMHGTPFIQSGKQAVKLLTLNICNTISLCSIGDFVIVMSEVFVVCLSVLSSYLIFSDIEGELGDFITFCHLFIAGTALICCYTILGTFENAFSTMFLCVCQDFMMNNGTDKPYAMTRNLMEFLEGSKKLHAKQIEEKGLPTI